MWSLYSYIELDYLFLAGEELLGQNLLTRISQVTIGKEKQFTPKITNGLLLTLTQMLKHCAFHLSLKEICLAVVLINRLDLMLYVILDNFVTDANTLLRLGTSLIAIRNSLSSN